MNTHSEAQADGNHSPRARGRSLEASGCREEHLGTFTPPQKGSEDPELTFTRARLRDMPEMVPEKKGFTKMSSNAPEERPGSQRQRQVGVSCSPSRSPGTSVGTV